MKLPLEELRTEQPLRDADFAAIRARVLSQIAEREQRRWLPLMLRVAAVVVMIGAAVFLVSVRQPAMPVNAPQQPVADSLGGRASRPPLPGILPGSMASDETSAASGRDARPPKPPPPSPVRVARKRPPKRSTAPAVTQQVTRIEIQTADPNVRIIWIVKESS